MAIAIQGRMAVHGSSLTPPPARSTSPSSSTARSRDARCRTAASVRPSRSASSVTEHQYVRHAPSRAPRPGEQREDPGRRSAAAARDGRDHRLLRGPRRPLPVRSVRRDPGRNPEPDCGDLPTFSGANPGRHSLGYRTPGADCQAGGTWVEVPAGGRRAAARS